jgi:hypothetical protein
VFLLHGWPYDIHSFADVTPLLASAGYRVIVPYLGGYGTTRFLSGKTPRNGQQSVVAIDTIAFMDALKMAILAQRPKMYNKPNVSLLTGCKALEPGKWIPFAKRGTPEHPQKRLETTDSRGRICSETHLSFYVRLMSRNHPFIHACKKT